MKLYASELMELARKEPEKYEGKRYKASGDVILMRTGDRAKSDIIAFENGRPIVDGYATAFISADIILEEIPPEPKPVPFMEAVKAYSEGKTIRCEVVPSTTNQVYEYEPCGNGIALHGYKLSTYKGSGTAVTTKEILEGKWFIEE